MKKIMIAAGVGVLALCSMATADTLMLYQDSDDTTPPPSDADETSPWYFTADMGVNFTMKSTIKANQYWAPATPAFKFKPGLGMNLNVGYNFTKMFGLELSSGLQWNGVEEFELENLNNPLINYDQNSGDLYQIPLMVNLVVNFNVTDTFDIALVGGVGMQWTKFKSENNIYGTVPAGSRVLLDTLRWDHDSVAFRYNFGLRLNYAVAHNIKIGGNFLFTGSDAVDIGTPTANGGALGPQIATQNDKLKNLLNFSIGFGVNVAF